MDRDEKIYLYMCSEEYTPLTFDELRVALDVPEGDIPELYSVLEHLISLGMIFISKKHRYAPCKGNMRYVGVLQCNARGGFGFVTCEDCDEDVYIAKENLATAIDGDRVLVHIIGTSRGRKEGITEKILERGNSLISAIVTDNFCALPDNRRIFSTIKLTDMQTAEPGDRVIIELTDYAKNGIIYAIVVSVLGNSKSLSTHTDAILFENNIKREFDSDTIAEAQAFADTVSDNDRQGRQDFTKNMIFTIDGNDARDFDDAISLKILANNNYELGVHIADVSHYVRSGSALDREAFNRATSVYLPDRVIPMLPERLSNGLCSLVPNEDRLTLSIILEISPTGTIENYRAVKGVICSKYRMTYDDVAKILAGDSALCEKYAELVPTLLNMHKLSEILSNRRSKRGSINFDFPETKVILNNLGYPTEIVKVEKNDAHKLIEEFMLIANETVAELAYRTDIPFIYRTHAQPDNEKMEYFRRFIGSFGLYIKGKDVYPKDLQTILEKASGTENETLIATYMLRSLMKAEYRPECSGHFGLAAEFYCHFTSPIRRYPDLVIHRILKAFITGEDVMRYSNMVIEASKQASDGERRAELAERDVDDLMKAAYMADLVGNEFPAQISGITSFGIFAELENGIEGMIRLETITDDFYELNESRRTLIGRRRGKTYAIGDAIEVEVICADLTMRRIDFVIKGNKPYMRAVKPHKTYKKINKKRRGRKNGKI